MFTDISPSVLQSILGHVYMQSIESLTEWSLCLLTLAVCKQWRAVGMPLLYGHAVIEYRAHQVCISKPATGSRLSVTTHSSWNSHGGGIYPVANIGLILGQGAGGLVRDLTVCAPTIPYGARNNNAIISYLPQDICQLTGLQQVNPSSAHGMIAEAMLYRMPNAKSILIQVLDCGVAQAQKAPRLVAYRINQPARRCNHHKELLGSNVYLTEYVTQTVQCLETKARCSHALSLGYMAELYEERITLRGIMACAWKRQVAIKLGAFNSRRRILLWYPSIQLTSGTQTKSEFELLRIVPTSRA
ncbi:hypothetical protein GGF46_004861 [Coemansia sp. RSA 552]|nr:hypothetical protein GGF46_004861 [Coemansia sp. RSA 552]